MADSFNKEPISFVDQNEQFPVLDDKIGLTYQQFKTLVENTNYLYNNLGLSSIEINSVKTEFPSPGSFNDVIVEHTIEYVNGKPVDLLDFGFKIPTPRISASLKTEIVDENTPTGMTLVTAPIIEQINNANVTTGYEFEFYAKLPKTPEYYIQYIEQDLTDEQKAQARNNIGAGTSSFSGVYNDLFGKPNFSNVAMSGDYNDLINTPVLSKVAISGLYDDLINKPTAVLYGLSQNLSLSQQEQARNNIGAGTSSFSGMYNDLIDKPTKLSQFDNDVGYLTNATLNFVSYEEQNLSNIQKQQARNNIGAGTSNFDGKYSSLIGSPTLLSSFENDVGYITNASFDNYYTKIETDAKINNLSTVAKTGSYNDLLNKPINLSEFTNDTGFITNAVNNLLNYYTKEEIGNMFSGNVSFQFVTELPETGVESTVYFVSNSSGTTGNLFDEYVWTANDTWEQLGSVSVDLSDYYTKAEVDGLLPDMTNYYTKDDLSGKIIPEGNLSNFSKNGASLTLVGQQNGQNNEVSIKFNNGINGVAGTIYKTAGSQDSIYYKNRFYDQIGYEPYKVRWNFDDVQTQISGNNLVTNLTGTNTLNIGKVYTCISDSTNGEYKAGHFYLIGGKSGAYTTTDITPLSDSSIETISLNGVELPITNKNVDISIPTQLSGFSNDVGYITLEDIPDVDLSNYYTKDETNNLVDTATYVSYNTVQSLTDVQKARARQNIDATNFSGEYNDLLNRPTFATVAISGNYADLFNRPVIDTTIANSTNAVQNKAIYNRFASVDNDILSATTTANNAYSTAQNASSTANNINSKLNSLTLVDNGDNTYTLKFTQDNVSVGTITIPDDQYIETVNQNLIQNNIIFTWKQRSVNYPTGQYSVDLSPYVYTAGAGISTAKISDTDNRNVLSVLLDTTDENNKLFFNSSTGGLNVNLSTYATIEHAETYAKTYADTLVNNLIDGAPETLDTLKEIADWIANDETGTAALTNRVANNETSISTLNTNVSNINNEIDTINNTILELNSSIPNITLNGSVTKSPSFYAPTTAGTKDFFLKSNGFGEPIWAEIPDNSIAIDTVLSSTSTNPVQNKIITNTIHDIIDNYASEIVIEEPYVPPGAPPIMPIVISAKNHRFKMEDFANGLPNYCDRIIDFKTSNTSTSYIRFVSGLLIAWGQWTVGKDITNYSHTYGFRGFTFADTNYTLTLQLGVASYNDFMNGVGFNSKSTTGFNYSTRYDQTELNWFAIGKWAEV